MLVKRRIRTRHGSGALRKPVKCFDRVVYFVSISLLCHAFRMTKQKITGQRPPLLLQRPGILVTAEENFLSAGLTCAAHQGGVERPKPPYYVASSVCRYAVICINFISIRWINCIAYFIHFSWSWRTGSLGSACRVSYGHRETETRVEEWNEPQSTEIHSSDIQTFNTEQKASHTKKGKYGPTVIHKTVLFEQTGYKNNVQMHSFEAILRVNQTSLIIARKKW